MWYRGGPKLEDDHLVCVDATGRLLRRAVGEKEVLRRDGGERVCAVR